MGLMSVCRFADNGVRSGMRSGGALTSFGAMCYAGKKAGKSNYTDVVFENADRFQLWLNRAMCGNLEKERAATALAEVRPGGADKDGCTEDYSCKPTVCVFKNVGPEEMLARCSPTRPGGLHGAAIRAEAEMATFLEHANLLGTGSQHKKYEHQGSLNELYDTGAPSKLYRGERTNYGADLFATWHALTATKRAPQTAFYHTGCLNIAQAFALVTEEEGLHAMALLERYIMAPLLPVNPYTDPPEAYGLPSVDGADIGGWDSGSG